MNVIGEHGAETLQGFCRYSQGGANIQFNGGINNGNVNVDSYGNMSGVVAGFSFQGRR